MTRLSFPLPNIGIFLLSDTERKNMCYQYVDNLAYEHVIHDIFYPSFGYQMSQDFSVWYMPYSGCLAKAVIDPNTTVIDECAMLDNRTLYTKFGVNYFELLRQYQNHICVMELNDDKQFNIDLSVL